MWVAHENVVERLEGFEIPFSDIKNVLEEIRFEDEATRSRCRGWLVLKSLKYLQADILFPGCKYDCTRLTIRGRARKMSFSFFSFVVITVIYAEAPNENYLRKIPPFWCSVFQYSLELLEGIFVYAKTVLGKGTFLYANLFMSYCWPSEINMDSKYNVENSTHWQTLRTLMTQSTVHCQ